MSISSLLRCKVLEHLYHVALECLNSLTTDMDTHIGDLHSAIVDREIEILQDLLQDVLVHDKMIGNVCDICAELDCLLSFAEASNNHNYRQPDMTDDNVIEIVAGRFLSLTIRM